MLECDCSKYASEMVVLLANYCVEEGLDMENCLRLFYPQFNASLIELFMTALDMFRTQNEPPDVIHNRKMEFAKQIAITRAREGWDINVVADDFYYKAPLLSNDPSMFTRLMTWFYEERAIITSNAMSVDTWHRKKALKNPPE